MKLSFYRFLFFSSLLLLTHALPAYSQEEAPQTPPLQQQPPETSKEQPAQVMTTQPQATAQKPTAESRNTGDSQVSVELFYWLTYAEPELTGGQKYFNGDPSFTSDFQLPGKSKRTPGVMLSFPAGKENTLRISYFTTKGRGDTIAGRNLHLFGKSFTTGDLLMTRYNLENIKVSWDYLTFPFPPESKFRLKTLWELQYTRYKSSIDTPQKQKTPDPTTGVFPDITARKTLSLFYPTFGLAGEYSVSKHFRLQGRGSAFAWPHRGVIWDLEGAAAFRFGHVEALLGAKSFHLKTSPMREEYVTVDLNGPYVALRWYW